MRYKVDIDTSNVNLGDFEKHGLILQDRLNRTVINSLTDQIHSKIHIDNEFKENRIVNKSIKIDVYNSSTIDFVKQKIEALNLPLITKVELLTLLDDDNMFNHADLIAHQLKEIIDRKDSSALQYLMRKQFDFRISVDKLNENDIKILFYDMFNNTFVDHEKLFENFLKQTSVGFMKNRQNFYYHNTIFTYLADLNTYING